MSRDIFVQDLPRGISQVRDIPRGWVKREEPMASLAFQASSSIPGHAREGSDLARRRARASPARPPEHAIMPPMRIDDVEASLRGQISQMGLQLGGRDVAAVTAAIIDWYAQERAQDAAPIDEDGDMLLFQWGVHDWGDGPAFEYGLTRQLIRTHDEGDEGIVQLALTYRFAVTDLAAGLGSGQRWCLRPADVAGFEREIAAHPATAVARSSAPTEVLVRCEVAG